MTTGTPGQDTIHGSIDSALAASRTESLAKDAQSLPRGTLEHESQPPMLQAMHQLLIRNEQSLREVSHLLPPQSLSYLRLLMVEMVELHLKKAAGYSGLETTDTWKNFRKAEELGIPTWKAVLARKQDKVSRYTNLARDLRNDQLQDESLRDTLRDDSAYGLIAICLLDEGDSVAESHAP